MTKVLEQLFDLSQLLHLPRFLVTLRAVLLSPLGFFAHYREIVGIRRAKFSEVNTEAPGDPYMGPVKFAGLALLIENTLFPLGLSLGLAAGVVSPHFVEFADWAEQAGYLDPFAWTGVWFIDDAIQDFFRLITFYGLGVLIYLFSARRVPLRFATGYFLYINAWTMIGALLNLGFILLAFVLPVYETGLPQLVGFLVNLVMLFMLIGFPILFWPRFLDAPRSKVALSLLLGFVAWVAVIAVLAPLIIEMPSF